MDLRQLRQFVAVAETLHFGRAAQQLSMAQPPLSRSIHALEDELGVPLFERSKKRVALAPAGRAMLPEARAVLAAAGRLAGTARGAAQGVEGELALSFISIVDYSFLPDLLRRFTSRYPAVRVSLREATTDVQLADLRAGRIDAGILLGPPAAEPSEAVSRGMPALAYRRLIEESLVLALPARHRLAKAAATTPLAAFEAEPFISIPRHTAPRLYDAMIGECRGAGFSPRIVQEAIQMQTIISLVAAGMGVALVPESIMSLTRPGIAYRRLPAAGVALEVGIAWRQDNTSAVLGHFTALASQSRPGTPSPGARRRAA